MFELVYPLVTSVLFGVDKVPARKGLMNLDAFTGIVIGTVLGTPIFLSVSIVDGSILLLGAADLYTLALLALAGILHFVVGRTLGYSSLKRIGANRASPIFSTSTLYSVAFGIALLNEAFTANVVFGAAFVAAGVSLISISEAPQARIGVQPPPVTLTGVALCLGAAFVWGVTPLLVRVGVVRLGSPVLGTLISYCFAVGLGAPLLLLSGRRRLLKGIDRAAQGYIAAWGVMMSVGQLFRYLSLAVAPVSMVTPIVGGAPLFTLLAARFTLREVEVFVPRVLLGTVFIVAGVTLVALTF